MNVYQQNFGFNQQSSFGSSVPSQYRGLNKTFQPTGYVQSVYGQNQASNSNVSSFTNNAYSSAPVSTDAFHTANYRGYQAGHDNYLRADSTKPTQSGFSGVQNVGVSQFGSNIGSSFGSNVGSSVGVGSSFGTGVGSTVGSSFGVNSVGNVGSSFGVNSVGNVGSSFGSQAGQFSSAPVSTQAYHTANYRGNQPGHDTYLRADSTQPSQSSFNTGFSGVNQNQNFGVTSFSNVGSNFNTAGGFAGSQSVSPQSYHTANYRGDQSGHDTYLRADSTQPSQSQFGTSNVNSTNFGGFGTSSFNRF